MHNEGEEIWVRLTGGGPFGLRLGGRSSRWEPLVVAKLHKKSKARTAGVHVGDVVLSINDSRCDVMTLQTASDLVDFSRDLSLQLFRSPTTQVLEHETSSVPSFRQHQQPPAASRSPTFSPFLSDPEFSSTTHLHPRQSTTELFRHHVTSLDSRHQRRLTSPLTSSDAELQDGIDGRTEDRNPVQKFGTGGFESKLQPDKTEKSGRGGGGGGGGRRWQPGEKAGRPEVKWAPKISDVPESQLENAEWNGDVNGSIPRVKEFTPPSILLPKPPSFTARAKPDRWQPSGSSQLIGEAATAGPEEAPRPESSRRSDAFVHEVVIWSSKTTEVEKLPGDDSQSHKKPLPWQPKCDSNRVDRTEDSQAPARWQPSSHGNQPTPVTWQPPQPTTTDSRVAKATDAVDQPFRWRPETNNEAKQPPTWQPPPQPTVVKETESKEPSAWQPDNERVQGRRRWQPTQPPEDALDEGLGGSHRLQDRLEEPRGAPQDGSTSPAVTSLFLRRVVTDGSALVAGSGSDADVAPDVSCTGKKRLYADSSFYEDPEHKYPTIEEQIKMARKVAILLTSPVNKNAKGQRMFLKRKEQSSKWIIDPKNLALHPLIITPPAPEPNSSLLSPVQVEKLRLYGDKSLHDVIPFDVCSMLAAELREEKGRGGRLFAKRRDQADRSSAPETKGLVRVTEPPSFQQESKEKYVPQTLKSNYVTETIARIPPPPPPQPPVVQESRDVLSEHLLPVNRLKSMIDLPRAKITPWDSAIEYGTVEPAFEHLQGYHRHHHHHHQHREYLPFDTENVSLGTGSTLNQTGRVEMKSQGHSFGERQSSYKGVESLGSSAYQQDSYPPAQGFVPAVDSSCFIRQATAAVTSTGYRPVRFQVGTRNFK